MPNTEYPLGQVVVRASEVKDGKVDLGGRLKTRGQHAKSACCVGGQKTEIGTPSCKDIRGEGWKKDKGYPRSSGRRSDTIRRMLPDVSVLFSKSLRGFGVESASGAV